MIEQTISNDADPQCRGIGGPFHMQRLCVLVCGTHRCGTSAVTRVINLLGADIARDLIPARSDNARGYWESAAVIGIHDELLNLIGPLQADPFDPLSLPTAWQNTQQTQRAKYQLMDHVETEFAGSSLFVVKDPRISRLLPLWIDALKALSINVIVVIPFRNPLEVAASLAQRDAVSLPKALLLYLQSYLDIEFASRSRRRVFVRYDSLFSDWRAFQTQLSELSDMQLTPPSSVTNAKIEDFLTTDLYHQRFNREELLSHPDVATIMVDLYDNMCKAVDRDDLLVRAAFDRLRGYCEHADKLYRDFIGEELTALRRRATAERNALKEEFERSTSWRVTTPLRWTKLIATTGFRFDPSAVFRMLTLRRVRKGDYPAWPSVAHRGS
jgi:hypothetical protein